MQIFENAISANWAMITTVFMYMLGLYSFDTIIHVIRSLIFGHKQQYFNRYKIYQVRYKKHQNKLSK